MSLFGDNRYQYRETYFVLFEKRNCPAPQEIEQTLAELGPKYETVDVRLSNGVLESMTVRSPHDFSAMDITYLEGEEVRRQVTEIQEEFRTMTLSGDDIRKLGRLKSCDARFDIYHFEDVAGAGGADDGEEFLDPGGLLIVLERLAKLCDGVALDPQSQSLM